MLGLESFGHYVMEKKDIISLKRYFFYFLSKANLLKVFEKERLSNAGFTDSGINLAVLKQILSGG